MFTLPNYLLQNLTSHWFLCHFLPVCLNILWKDNLGINLHFYHVYVRKYNSNCTKTSGQWFHFNPRIICIRVSLKVRVFIYHKTSLLQNLGFYSGVLKSAFVWGWKHAAKCPYSIISRVDMFNLVLFCENINISMQADFINHHQTFICS